MPTTRIAPALRAAAVAASLTASLTAAPFAGASPSASPSASPTATSSAGASGPGATVQASVSALGATPVGSFATPRLEGDVVFASTASALTDGDTNGVSDIFLRYDGRTRRVPAFQLNGASSQPTLGHGLVVFSSRATNIGSDTNGVQDVFLWHEEGESAFRVSVSDTEGQADGASGEPSVSDGNILFDPVGVAFTSTATNLVAGDTNGSADVFVRQLNGGRTIRVSVATGGGQADSGASSHPDISSDGRYVAFTSTASDLVPGDTNGSADVFVRDLVAGTTSRVSVDDAGAQAYGAGTDPSISWDGRYVAFASTDPALADGVGASTSDVYVRDRVSGTTSRASRSTSGQPADGPSTQPALSGDGLHVVFTSAADNLVTGDTNGRRDVFLRDFTTNTTTRESVSSAGVQSRSDSHSPAVEFTGRSVAFVADADGGLVPGDTSQGVLVRQPEAPPTPFGDFDADGLSDVIARSATGQLNLYRGTGSGLAPPVPVGASGWSGMSAVTRLGDVDRDGLEDVLASERSTGRLWLYPGRRTSFAPRVLVGASGWNGMREMTAVGDLDVDHRADVVAVQSSTGDLYLYPGRGSGFAPRRLIGHGGWNAMDELTGVGDLDGDGRNDLVARRPSTGELWLYPGNLAGTGFSPRQRIGLGWNGMRGLVGVGDFRRTGSIDLVAVQSSTSTLYVYESGQFRSQPSGSGFTSGLRPLL
jgi:hypothetical protein